MYDNDQLVPPPTAIDCYHEVLALSADAAKLKDTSLVEHVSFLMNTFECLPRTDRVISLYFQTGDLSSEDRHFLEMTYVAMYGAFAIGDDNKIVTTIIKG